MYKNTLILFALGLFFSGSCFGELTDPTKPSTSINTYTSQDVAMKDPVLSVILNGNDRQVAVINGQLAKVGDVVDGFTLIRIKNSSVHLRGSQGEIVLLLSVNKIKSPTHQ